MKKEKITVEDILTGNVDYTNVNNIPSDQLELADAIKRIINESGNEKLPPLEKKLLWKRIENDTQLNNRERHFSAWLKIAASIFIVLSIGLAVYSIANTSELQLIASKTTPARSSAEIQLILSNQKTIKLGEKSSIVYKANGEITENTSSKLIGKGHPGIHTLIVPYGKHSQITLDDGTRIWLNSGSKLVYQPSFAEKNSREVYLSGEAYFDVAHNENKPFFVLTKNSRVKVLGTEFNVSSYEDDKKDLAMLVKGSIELTTGSWLDEKKELLKPGDLATYEPGKNTLTISAANSEDYASWKDGYLSLEHASLADILKKISRHYNVHISIDQSDLKDEFFSGKLDLSQSIDDVMEVLSISTSVVYEPKERRIRLGK